MKSQINEFTYPESELIYEEIEGVKAEVYLPEYVVKTIKERAEALGGEVSVRLWWPYVYIYIEKDFSKEIEDCYDIAWSKAERDAINDCEEKCNDDERCFEECVDVWKHSVYKSCLEDIGDEIRPSITKAVYELEHIFKLYGIEADVETQWYNDVIEIRVRLKGYREIIPMWVGQLLLVKVVDASMARTYRDREKLTYKLTSFLYTHLSESRFIELAMHLSKDNIRITKMLDKYNDLRRYEMLIEWKDVKIALYVTEESENGHWTVTDINVGYVEQVVIDLTPA